jgi:DNA-binding HxlR family transcriptional regulator
MRGRSVPVANTPRALAPVAGRNSALEEEFRRFRHAATEFSASLAHHADFRSKLNGAAVAQINLRAVRSIFGKWSLDILVLLVTERELGFAELRKALRGISSRILSSKLKRLEAHGLVRREVLATRPPRVNYGLTDRGLTVTRLGEPVLLYLRFIEGLYVGVELPGHSRVRPSAAMSISAQHSGRGH